MGFTWTFTSRAQSTRGLPLRGVDILTAQLDGTAEKSDPELLDKASELGRVLFSQDEDFLAEAARRQQSGIAFGGLIYAHQLGITIGECINDLEIIAKTLNPDDFANRVEYLPL